MFLQEPLQRVALDMSVPPVCAEPVARGPGGLKAESPEGWGPRQGMVGSGRGGRGWEQRQTLARLIYDTGLRLLDTKILHTRHWTP